MSVVFLSVLLLAYYRHAMLQELLWPLVLFCIRANAFENERIEDDPWDLDGPCQPYIQVILHLYVSLGLPGLRNREIVYSRFRNLVSFQTSFVLLKPLRR